MQQRKLESVADCCCGRDRHHSDGFYKGLCRLRGDLSLPASATTFRRRAILLCSNDGAASIPKFGPEIKNRCTQERVNGENLASILKSGLEIKNRCSTRLKNRCSTMESALCRGRGMPDGQAESDAGALSLPAGKLGLGLCSDQPLLRVGVDRCLDYFKFREGFFE